MTWQGFFFVPPDFVGCLEDRPLPVSEYSFGMSAADGCSTVAQTLFASEGAVYARPATRSMLVASSFRPRRLRDCLVGKCSEPFLPSRAPAERPSAPILNRSTSGFQPDFAPVQQTCVPAQCLHDSSSRRIAQGYQIAPSGRLRSQCGATKNILLWPLDPTPSVDGPSFATA